MEWSGSRSGSGVVAERLKAAVCLASRGEVTQHDAPPSAPCLAPAVDCRDGLSSAPGSRLHGSREPSPNQGLLRYVRATGLPSRTLPSKEEHRPLLAPAPA